MTPNYWEILELANRGALFCFLIIRKTALFHFLQQPPTSPTHTHIHIQCSQQCLSVVRMLQLPFLTTVAF